MIVPCIVSEILDVEWWCDLEIWVKGRSRSLKMELLFDRPYTTPYQSVIVSIALYFTILELFDVVENCDLEN